MNTHQSIFKQLPEGVTHLTVGYRDIVLGLSDVLAGYGEGNVLFEMPLPEFEAKHGFVPNNLYKQDFLDDFGNVKWELAHKDTTHLVLEDGDSYQYRIRFGDFLCESLDEKSGRWWTTHHTSFGDLQRWVADILRGGTLYTNPIKQKERYATMALYFKTVYGKDLTFEEVKNMMNLLPFINGATQ